MFHELRDAPVCGDFARTHYFRVELDVKRLRAAEPPGSPPGSFGAQHPGIKPESSCSQAAVKLQSSCNQAAIKLQSSCNQGDHRQVQ
jgi:hypothetical protein